LVLIVIGISVLASPLTAILALFMLGLSLLALLVRAVRRRPLRHWAAVAATSFVLLLVFGGIAQALYGTAPQEIAPTVDETTEQTTDISTPQATEETTASTTQPTEESETTPPTPQSAPPQQSDPSPEPAAPIPSATASADPLPDGSCPPEFPIKGNATSGIYHTRGKQSYNKTKAEACFARPSDAEDAGFRAAKK